MKGFFVIEGIDGCGKGLLVKNLKKHFGKKAVYLREPAASPYGKKLRETFSTGRVSREEEYELFLQDRKWDVENNILPALESGKIVIMDRYYHSTIAYQGALGVYTKKIIEDNRSIAPMPEKVFLLDLPVSVAAERINKRRNTFEDPAYQEKVREIYLKLKNMLEEDICVIDATMSPKGVSATVSEIIEKTI